MKPNIYLPLILAFVCFNLLAQPKIVSLTYNGDVATLTRNAPPPGIIYYWQGTSCGTLMTDDNLTYLASTSSTFYLRAYTSTGDVWAESCASTVVFFPDVVPPVLSGVSAGPVNAGDDILATSNEDGIVYLVPTGTASNLGAITAAKVAEFTATANVAGTLTTTGLAEGDYVVYAVDGSDNISAASAAITVTWATSIDPNLVQSDKVQLYPSDVIDILHIKSKVQVSSATIYTLQGSQVIKIATPTEQIDMSGLSGGVYVVSIKLMDNTVFSSKVTKR